MNDHLFRVDWYEVGTRFRTVDRNSSDADKIFVRREHDIAIEGFKDLTEQEVFDMAARHILSTGKKSLGFNRCVYSGTGCAAAPFIKEYFRRSMDQYGAWENLVAKGEVPGEHMHLIGQLQYAHDYSDRKDFLPQFKQHMRVVASMFNLSDKVLED